MTWYGWSFINQKTYIDQSPKPQVGSKLEMHENVSISLHFQ